MRPTTRLRELLDCGEMLLVPYIWCRVAGKLAIAAIFGHRDMVWGGQGQARCIATTGPKG